MGGRSSKAVEVPGALPLDHLSASSINLFKRCPRQWQNVYIHGDRGPANSSTLIGSATHLALSRLLHGDVSPGDYWGETVALALSNPAGIDWSRMPEPDAKEIAAKHVQDYMTKVAPFLGEIVACEQEIEIIVPGVSVPIVGFVDIETHSKVIDVKTTAWFNWKPNLNPEWAFQLAVYQCFIPKPGEIHVLTRGDSKYSVTVPSSKEDPLHRPPTPNELVFRMIRQSWETMNHYWRTYGRDEPWPGNETQEWGWKYCSLPDCCAIGKWKA